MTDYQRQVVDHYMRYGRKHKRIAWEVGTTAAGVRSLIRKLEAKGKLPDRYEWPVPRP